MRNFMRIPMRIKEKTISGIKATIFDPLTKRINAVSSKVIDILRLKSFTALGYEIKNIRRKYYKKINKDDYEFEYELYIQELKYFYFNDTHAKTICVLKKLDFTKELLFRRKELQHQSSYLSNLFIGVGTGFFSGLVVNNVPLLVKFEKFINELNPILGIVIHLISFILLFIVVLVLAALILIIFKNTISSECPYAQYTEEKELQIIEDILKTRLG